MLQSAGKLYIASTGGGIKSSTDGVTWSDEGALPWNRSLPDNQGVWAPDGIFYRGKYVSTEKSRLFGGPSGSSAR